MNVYKRYKDSGSDWIGRIPLEWESWKLSHAFQTIGSGTTPEAGNVEYYENGEINWLNTGDLNDGILHACAKKVTRKALEDYSSLKIFPAGSLVIAMYGATIGKTSIIDFETTTNQACCVFCKGEIIEVKFLYYWFRAHKRHIINLAIGGGQPNISQAILKDLRVFCPSLIDQQKICTHLDRKTAEIDQLIAKKQKLIELLEEERTALINQAVTKGIDPKAKMKHSGIEWLGDVPAHWEVKRIESLAETITGYAFKSEFFSFDDGIKIVRGDNVTEGSLRWGDKTRKWQTDLERLSPFSLAAGDIVIGMDGSKVGKNYAMVREEDLPLLLVQRVARIRAVSAEIANLILYTVGSYNFRYHVNLSKTDPAIPHITLKNITSYPIFLPPLVELRELLAYLDVTLSKLDISRTKIQQEIDLLNEYKTALISEVITGKVDVREEVQNTKREMIET